MKLHWPIRKSTPDYRRQAWKAAPVMVAQQSEDGVEYLLAKPMGTKWLVESFGFWQPEPSESAVNDVWPRFFSLGLAELMAQGIAIGGRKLLLCVKRPAIEFHRMDLLRVDGVDLTEQVHNQMAVQERLDAESMIVDYASESSAIGQQRPIFVTGLARDTWERWQTAWRGGKLHPVMMVPRPWATWQLVREQASISTEPTLVVALYRKQADLIVLDQRRPIFIRSINLQQPDASDGVAQQMMSEIRLTVGTVDWPGEEQNVSQIVILGDREFAEAVASQIQDSLEIATNVVALETLPSISYVDNQTPDINSAPLLGLLIGFTQTPDLESMDLMNPKTMAQPVSRWRIYSWLAVLVIMGLGYGAFDLWQRYDGNQQALQEQSQKNKEAQANLDRTTPKARVAEYLQRWETEQLNWLQQLDEITKSLPSGDEVVVRQYDGKRTATGAEISMQIQARSLETIEAIKEAVQKNGWQLKFKRQVETQDATYPFRLETTISYNQEP
jgi:hypothetical protein